MFCLTMRECYQVSLPGIRRRERAWAGAVGGRGELREGADLDDAGGLVVRTADEAEAVGQQRQAEHCVCVVREGAQDAPSLTLKSLTVSSSEPESALAVGSATRARHLEVGEIGACRAKVFSRVPLRRQTRIGAVGRAAAEDTLAVGHRRHRETAGGVRRRCSTRLLLATLHTLMSGPEPLMMRWREPLMMCWPSGVTATTLRPSRGALEGVDEQCPSTTVQRAAPGGQSPADHEVHAVGQRREISVHAGLPSSRRCARERRR